MIKKEKKTYAIRVTTAAAVFVLGVLLTCGALVQATPIGGPLGDARNQVKDLLQQFADFVDLLHGLEFDLNDGAAGDDHASLFDLIDQALNAIDTGEDANSVAQKIEDAVAQHHKIITTNFDEVHTSITEIDEAVGSLSGRIEALTESGKLKLSRANKIQRKIDTISGNITLIQDALKQLESEMEDGDEGEDECKPEDSGFKPNCFDDVADFLFAAIDTVSADPTGFDANLVSAILSAGQVLINNILHEIERIFDNLKDISRALKTIESEVRRAQSDFKKGINSPLGGALGMAGDAPTTARQSLHPAQTRIQIYDLRGQRVLDETVSGSAERSAAIDKIPANGVYFYVLTRYDGRGQMTDRSLGRLVVRR